MVLITLSLVFLQFVVKVTTINNYFIKSPNIQYLYDPKYIQCCLMLTKINLHGVFIS